MAYYLEERTLNCNPKFVRLTTAEVCIGTHSAPLLREYPKISAKHAAFYVSTDGKLFIRDLGSDWGTYVNDVRIGPTIMSLNLGDKIGFGVNSRSPENGFVCVLKHDTFKEMPFIKKEPEIIDLSDEDDCLPKIVADSVKTVSPPFPGIKAFDVVPRVPSPANTVILSDEDCENSQCIHTTPSISRKHTFIQKYQPDKSIKKCSVPLIRCDCESFPWPPDVKNPFLIESEDDDDILIGHKKPSRKISSDSSTESCDEDNCTPWNGISSNLSMKETGNKQSQLINNKYFGLISSKSSPPKSYKQTFVVSSTSQKTKHSSRKRNLNYRKKRARKISSDSSDEVSDDPSSSESYENRISFSKQSKAENYSRSSCTGLPESSSDSSVESLDKIIYLDKKNRSDNSKLHPESSSFDSFVGSSSGNMYLNSVSCSTKKIADPSSFESYETNIKKTVVSKETFQFSDNDFTNIRAMGSLHITEDSCDDLSNRINSYSMAEEIIELSDGDDYFDIETAQTFIPIKTEPEDEEDLEYIDIYKEIFEGNEETDNLSSSVIFQNSAFENQEPESIERIQEFVNRFAKPNSLEAVTGGNEELNSKLTDSESEVSSGESFLPGVKSLLLSKSQFNKNSKSSGKTLLTDPKPMTYRPRKMRGRDEGYVERQIPPYPKRKRGRPRKGEQLQNNTIQLNSCITLTKIPNTTVESTISLNNIKAFNTNKVSIVKPLPKRKDVSKTNDSSFDDSHFSESKIKKIRTDPKTIQICPSNFKDKNEVRAEKEKSLDPLVKKKKGRPKKTSELQHEVSRPILSTQVLEKPLKSKENISSNDHHKKSSLSSSTGIKGTKKCTSSVKVRPEKFCSRMGFLTTEEPISVRKEKMPEKTKKFKGVIDVGKNNVPKIRSESEVRIADQKRSKVSEKILIPVNGSQVGRFEDKLSEMKRSYVEDKHPEKKRSNYIDGKHLEKKRSNYIDDKHFEKKRSNSIEDKHSEKKRFSFNEDKHAEKKRSNSIEDKHSEKKRFSFNEDKYAEKKRSSFNEDKHAEKKRSSFNEEKHAEKKRSSVNEDKHAEKKRSSFTHSLHTENFEERISRNDSRCLARASSRRSMSVEENKLPYELNVSGMAKSLIKFKTIWLQEQRKIPHPPSAVTRGVAPLPLSFTSYESYVSSFYPLLLLDIWQFMFEESKEVMPNKKMCKRFSFRVLTYVHDNDCIELKCESVVNERCYFEPREGMITVLEMKVNMQQSYPLFGFISKHKKYPLDLNLLHPCWKKTSAEYLNNAKLWTFSVLIKQKDLFLEPDILMRGNGICYIRNKLRLVDALQCFIDSPLLTDIIEPRLSTFVLSCSKFSSNDREYTSRQKEIIKAVCSEIYKPECKIALIRGPPGTGKTHVIMGILETLFYGSKFNSNLKVLVTAPSSVAVDEIGCRLIELNERYGWRDYTVKFVRVGVEKQIHPKMMEYFIDHKAEELHKKNVRLSNNQEKVLQDLRLKICNLEMEPDSENKKYKLKELHAKYNHIEDSFSLKKQYYLSKINYKSDILKESHIVLTTLSSCNLSSVLSKTSFPASKFDLNFSCCIVDESTQCTELEILQPLALGMSKLILVGDNRQLPSNHSEYSKKYGWDRSMFERFCQYFENTKQPNPVLSLTEQFRMHPLICEFPSKYFYGEKLSTHPDTAEMYKDFPLKPYIVLDIAQLSDSFSETIKDCELLIYNICKFLVKYVDSSSSIGVIVPHDSQRSLCAKFMHSHSHYRDVEINTVNGFQGKEKDIIVLCAIEPKLPFPVQTYITCERKLNVALTRAKKCLIICLDATILRKYSHWKALCNGARERKICFTVTSPRDVSSVLRFARGC